MNLAGGLDCVIVNADSMQVYRGLRLITARPSAHDEERIPHTLFGHVSPHEDYSVARWVEEAVREIETGLNAGKRVLVVGGTGLYFSALTKGLSAIPEIDPAIRDKWRRALAGEGEDPYTALMRLDPAAANGLKPNDQQRICRALEVIESTGRSLLEWQRESKPVPLAQVGAAKKIVLMPDRKQLHARIDRRFERMIEQGAVEEVRAFLELGVDRDRTAMKAIGVPQLAAFIAGEQPLAMAIEQAKAASRQYAKRQYTWFRNQFGADWEVHA